MVEWRWYTFEQLDNDTLYSIIALRQLVFVLEQRCTYQDLDNQDQSAHHLLGTVNSELAVYLRVLPTSTPSIGRVVTRPESRNQGLATAAMTEAIRFTRTKFPRASIRVAAQAHLRSFYANHGFVPTSHQYLQVGIPHIDMHLAPESEHQQHPQQEHEPDLQHQQLPNGIDKSTSPH